MPGAVEETYCEKIRSDVLHLPAVNRALNEPFEVGAMSPVSVNCASPSDPGYPSGGDQVPPLCSRTHSLYV